METLVEKTRKSRKDHICDYCANKIAKGETYRYSKHVCDGRLYEWKCHIKCEDLAQTIWDIADPDEGMTEGLFRDTLGAVAHTFVCPDCPYRDAATDDCDCELDPKCIDRVHEFFQTRRLEMTERWTWRVVKREGGAK